MEEKIIIKGTYSHVSKFLPLLLAFIGFILSCIGFDDGDVFGGGGAEYVCMFLGGIVLIAGAVILLLYIGNCEIAVSNVRVYGKAAFGKRVDLPVDSISAIATTMFSGIAVATSSGRVCFLGLKNAAEIHRVLSGLIIKRQFTPVSNTTIKQEIPQSNADELKKYKDLLDSGVISQEEFDAKKKQLLGL